jgi:hypothetical protein
MKCRILIKNHKNRYKKKKKNFQLLVRKCFGKLILIMNEAFLLKIQKIFKNKRNINFKNKIILKMMKKNKIT